MNDRPAVTMPGENLLPTDADVDALVRAVVKAARPGDHVLCMSNGGFGGVHGRLLAQLTG